MDGFVFVEVSAVILAVVGALAALFGTDSRPCIEDTHQAHNVTGD